MLSDILEDDDRFRKIIDEAIDKGEVENYPAYESENKDAIREKAKEAERKRREEFVKNYGTSKEAAEKAKLKQKSKGKKDAEGDLGDLAALIQQRQRARMGNLFDKLEEKYAPKSRGTKRATPMDDEPTEEEFQATRKRLAAQSKSRRSTKKVVESDHEEEEGLDDEEDIDLESEEKATPPPKARKQARRGLSRGRGGARAKA
jgi:DnaJ family protein C protein 9